jgi:GNAT superfamily N-acetyltransferase
VSNWRLEVVTAEDELDALYAFRYRIYVEEMARPQKYADHAARRIRDPLDDRGYNIVAWDPAGQISGCVRINLARDGALDYYSDLLGLKAVGAEHPATTSVCTRLMILPEHRGSALATRLSCAAFDLGLNHGVVWNFLDCNAHLVEVFSRMGYERTHTAVHEEYGRVNVMRLNIRDYSHLKATGSIFQKSLERYHRRERPVSEKRNNRMRVDGCLNQRCALAP